tara:strand:+ start:333 stop:1220 length:888 start_codon:yes stop_codon:yes gene_type:complete
MAADKPRKIIIILNIIKSLKEFLMIKIIVLTDPHICEENQTIIGLNPSLQLKKALKHIKKFHSDANRLVVTGDLTHAGTKNQYSIFKNIIEGINIPITLLLGNHDNRENFRKVFSDYPLDSNGFVQSKEAIYKNKLIFLDTLAAPPYKNGQHFGEICKKRLEWIHHEMRLIKNEQIIVFMHHPPFKVGFPGMDEIKLKDSDQFMNLVKAFPNISHLVCGHIHRTISGNIQGKSFSIFKSTCHQMPMHQTSNKSSLSVAEPPAYGMLLINNTDIVAHSIDYELSDLKTLGSEATQN